MLLKLNLQLFAHKKGVGSSKNGRDSNSKRLGVKRTDGQFVLAGLNVGIGSGDTLFSKVDGKVKFERKDKTRKQVSVYPCELEA